MKLPETLPEPDTAVTDQLTVQINHLNVAQDISKNMNVTLTSNLDDFKVLCLEYLQSFNYTM